MDSIKGWSIFCILLSNPALQNFSYKSIPSKFLIDFLYDKKPDRMNTTTPIANITNCPRLTLEESFKLPKPGIWCRLSPIIIIIKLATQNNKKGLPIL